MRKLDPAFYELWQLDLGHTIYKLQCRTSHIHYFENLTRLILSEELENIEFSTSIGFSYRSSE